MSPDARPQPLVFPAAAFTINAGLAIWAWTLDAENLPWKELVFLPALWAFVEMAQAPGDSRRLPIMSWHRRVFGFIALFGAYGNCLRIAFDLGTLDASWAPLARRSVGILVGVMLTAWGNYLPKLLSPWDEDDQPFDWQRVHRFGGWLATLAGLSLVVLWLTAPVASARYATTAIFLTFAILVVGRKFASLATHRRQRPPATP